MERFYDAVVKPEGKEGTVTIEFSSEVTEEIKQTLEIGAEIGVPSLLGNLFSFLPKLNLKGAQDKTAGETTGNSHMIELHPISNPQRQLEHLTLHYLANHRNRLCLVSDRLRRSGAIRPRSAASPGNLSSSISLAKRSTKRSGRA